MNDLIAAAKSARLKAYAPYSKFLVGAAVRDERGQIHGGCNIENAAYPQGWCAETSAIAAMIMSGGKAIAEMAVIGTGDLLVHAMRRLPPENPRIRQGQRENPHVRRRWKPETDLHAR